MSQVRQKPARWYTGAWSLSLLARLYCRFCLSCLLATLPAAALAGLDSRPVNETCLAFDRPSFDASVGFERVFPSLRISNMVALTQPPGDSTYWYYTTRSGTIGRFVNTPSVSTAQTIVDLSTSTIRPVVVASDGGLIQLVFHPNYSSAVDSTERRVFVNYTTPGAFGEAFDTVISSFELVESGSTATIDRSSEVVLIRQPRIAFHQGGFMGFRQEPIESGGTRNVLLIGMGDGSRQQDPANLVQNLTDLRGKMLRLDVDGTPPAGETYSIPNDNPYASNPYCRPTGNSAPCPEIFAYGLRNPFRGDVDPMTGEIWVGDVGYTEREEVDKILKGGNYGWNIYEGTLCRDNWAHVPDGACADTSLIPPVVEYTHANGDCSVIGGYVYRGTQIPALAGRFVFADYCTGKVSAVQYDTAGNPFEEILRAGGSGLGNITTFGRDNNGELYVVAGLESNIYRITNAGGTSTSTAPATLSQTGCFDSTSPPIPAQGLIPFDLNAPLWSDGAAKRRWMALPEGSTVDIGPDGDFLFPLGTVLIKEFSYDGVPHETRLFVRHFDGVWAGYSYKWNSDGSDAALLGAGEVGTLPNGRLWTWPSRAECTSCHTAVANFSLGPELGQLNRDLLYPQTGRTANQLRTLESIGVFTSALPAPIEELPRFAGLDNTSQPIAHRARSYLHANCSGCHRPGETTQAPMDFRFSTPTDLTNTCSVEPVFGDLGVTGARILSPGNPDASVMLLRDGSRDPLIQMPPLATHEVHDEWITLARQWINDPNVCAPTTDTDLDGVPDVLDNCPTITNTDQADANGNGVGDVCDNGETQLEPTQVFVGARDSSRGAITDRIAGGDQNLATFWNGTGGQSFAWFTADLGSRFTVTEIRVAPRRDRVFNLAVRVGDTLLNNRVNGLLTLTCTTPSIGITSPTDLVSCPLPAGTRGRYITVNSDLSYLRMYGFEAYGSSPGIGGGNQRPVASFTSTVQANPLEVLLDGSGSTDEDGTIASYAWDFGDGSAPQTGELVNHLYAASGSYTVTLTVTDDDNAVATRSQTVTVSDGAEPVLLPVTVSSAGLNASIRDRIVDVLATGDQRLTTYWAASGGNAVSWYTVDLGTMKEVTSLRVAPRRDKLFALQVTVGNTLVGGKVSGTQTATCTTPNLGVTAPSSLVECDLPAGVSGRYITVQSNLTFLRMYGFEVLGR